MACSRRMSILTIPDARGVHVFTGRDEIIADLLEDIDGDEAIDHAGGSGAQCPGHPFWEREITSGGLILPEGERVLLQ
ncbi:MAG: hypothetical protein AAGI01_01990 [Myxococcota bacterium]